MSTTASAGNRFRALLTDILAESGLEKPDGRPLHAYRVTEEQYDQLQLYCMKALPRPDGLFAALFTLWASEHFRCAYDGSHLKWNFLAKALEKNLDRQQFVDATSWGLRYWKRPLRRGDQHRLFLQSLLVEGGLPQELLKPEGRYRSQILKLIGEAELRGSLAAEALPGLVRSVMARWPEGFRQDDVSRLISDFVLGLVDARRRIPPHIPRESSVAWLDGQHPTWRDELPINIGVDAAKSLLDEALRAEKRANLHKDFALRVLRKSENGDWLPFAEFPEKASVDRGVIPLGDPYIQTIRLRPTGGLSAKLPDLLIRGDLSEDGSRWELRRSSGRRTEITPWPIDEPLRFSVLADGKVAQEISISGKETPNADRPIAGIWVARDKSDETPSRLDYLTDGRAATSASRVFVQVASDAELECSGGVQIIEHSEFQGQNLICVTGQGKIESRTQKLSLKTSCDEEFGAQIRALGSVVPALHTTGGEVVYRGWPRFFGSEAGSYGADVSERNLRMVRPGGHLAPLDATKCLGGVTVGWLLDGEVVARQRIWMLPKEFAVKVTENTQNKHLHLSGLPSGSDVICGSQSGRAASDGSVDLILSELPEQATKALLEIRFGSDHMRCLVDLWTKVGAIIGPDDAKLMKKKTVARSKLSEWRLFCPDEACGALSVGLRGAAGTSWPPVSFRLDREASLGAFSSFIKSALSLGGPDAETEVCVFAHGLESPKLTIGQATMSLSVDENSLSWEGCDVSTVRWQSLTLPETIIDQDVEPLKRCSSLPDNLDLSLGPWMMIAETQSDDVVRPAVLPVFPSEYLDRHDAFSLDLQSAANATTRSQRVKRISECLRHRATDGADPDWSRIALLIDSVSEVTDPAWVDQVQALAASPDAATLILLQSEKDRQADRLALEEEAPFSWMALPLTAWKRAVATSHADIRQKLSASGLPDDVVAKIAGDTVMSRCENIINLRPELSAHLFLALFDLMPPAELFERGLAPPAQPIKTLEEQAELAVKRRLFEGCTLLSNAPVGDWPVLDRFQPESTPLLAAPLVTAELVLKERRDWPEVALGLLQCRQIDPMYFETALPAAISALYQRKTSND